MSWFFSFFKIVAVCLGYLFGVCLKDCKSFHFVLRAMIFDENGNSSTTLNEGMTEYRTVTATKGSI